MLFLILGIGTSNKEIRPFYQPAVSQCIKGTYGANDDGTVSVHNVGQKDPNGPVKEVCGYAETTDVGGVLDLYFPFTHGPNDYEILETDYESYACVWSCTPMLAGVFHREEGYILTREKESRDDLVEKCLKLYKDQGLDNMMDGFVTFYSGDDCKYEVETPDSSCEH